MATKVSSYKDLVVYQKSKILTSDVITHFSGYKLPIAKQFLLNQLFRAAGSIPANIAEGFGRNSKGSFRQFISIARGSSFEVDCWLEIMQNTGDFDDKKIKEFLSKNVEVSKMLSGLMKALH